MRVYNIFRISYLKISKFNDTRFVVQLSDIAHGHLVIFSSTVVLKPIINLKHFQLVYAISLLEFTHLQRELPGHHCHLDSGA